MSDADAIFGPLDQHAPGSDASSRRALGLALEGFRLPLRTIADLGCGSGRTSLLLAAETGARVTALDRDPAMLAKLRAAARRGGLAARIRTVQGDLRALRLRRGGYDLLWSEGAIYIAGLEAGLNAWRAFLRPGGRLVFSELRRLRPDPPAAARAFWDAAYPACDTPEAAEAAIERAGLRLVSRFTLPEADWLDGYYIPLKASVAAFRAARPGGEPSALADGLEAEFAAYEAGNGAYGYVVFIAERDGGPGAS